MRYRFVIIVVSVILLSCDNRKTDGEDGILTDTVILEPVSDFQKYLSTLDQIVLPLKHNPFGQLPEISKNYDKESFERCKHVWTIQPLGIYYRDEKTVGIIDCSIGDLGLAPFLTTYDLQGNKIDSTSFYEKSGQDIGYEAIEHLTFLDNRIIEVIDTVKRWDINPEETDIIESSMKMTLGKVEYRILKNGKIEKEIKE